MSDSIMVVEPWTYEVDGLKYEGRKVWHVEPPGPIGCGILYHETTVLDVLGEDGYYERHIYAWQLHEDYMREHPEVGE